MGFGQNIKRMFKCDKTILAIVLVLMVLSIVEVYSATSYYTHGQTNFLSPLKSHLLHCVLGVICMLVSFSFPYFKLKQLNKYILFPLSVILLSYLFVKALIAHDAVRSINLGFMNFQVSELAKLSVILFTANEMAVMPADPTRHGITFWRIMGVAFAFFLLIFPENLSTALMICIVVYTMMFLGGLSHKYLLTTAGSVALFAGVVLLLFCTVPQEKLASLPVVNRAATWQARILDKIESKNDRNLTPAEYSVMVAPDKLQETRANIAIASSHLLGKGPGNSNQKEYLKEASNDFMFAIIIEELGMIPAILIIGAYIALLLRIMVLARKCKDIYASLIISGIVLVFLIQAFVNMAVAVGLIPVTGQSLPFLTRGGSSILMSCIDIAIVLNVSKMIIIESENERNGQTLQTN